MAAGCWFHTEEVGSSMPTARAPPCAQVVPFSEALMLAFRDHGDRTDRQKARLMWLVERLGAEEFTKLVASYMGDAEFGPEVHPGYTDTWQRRDILGVHAQKQEGLSWVRAADCCLSGVDDFALAHIVRLCAIAACALAHASAWIGRGPEHLNTESRSSSARQSSTVECRGGTELLRLLTRVLHAGANTPHAAQVGACVPVGRFETDDFDALADVADKYSNGQMRVTCEENVLFPNVKNEDVEAMRKEPIFEKFQIDAGNLMRGLVSCTGSQFCGFAMIETKNRCALTADATALALQQWCACGCQDHQWVSLGRCASECVLGMCASKTLRDRAEGSLHNFCNAGSTFASPHRIVCHNTTPACAVGSNVNVCAGQPTSRGS